MFRSDTVLPLVRGRHGRAARRRSARRLGWRARTALLVLAALLVGGAAVVVVRALVLGDDFVFDDFRSLLPGFEVASRTPNADPSAVAPLRISSSPAGATVRLDGATSGRTPVNALVAPGPHSLVVHHKDGIDDTRNISIGPEGTDVDVVMWRRAPKVVPVWPVFPGANLIDARFLEDGSLTLLVGLPINTTAINPLAVREVWRLDPSEGDASRLVLGGHSELRPPVLAVAPDGSKVAYVGPMAGSAVRSATAVRSQAVWLSAPVEAKPPTLLYAPVDRDSRITDLSWDPRGQRLIVVNQLAADPPRTQIVLLDTSATGTNGGETLITMPATIVPGSESWDLQGRWLAFLSRSKASGGATVASLGAIEARPAGSFRYIADLGSPQPISAAPGIAWDPVDTGRVVFAGPTADAAKSAGQLDLFASLRSVAKPLGLFVTSVAPSADTTPRRLGSTTGLSGPLWRSEGLGIIGVGRGDDSSLVFRSVDPSSGVARTLDVHLPSGTGRGSALAVRWDERHGRALMLTRGSASDTSASSPALKAWLVDFVADAATRKP
jgi:PEGA domain